MPKSSYILEFSEIDTNDYKLVGSKGIHLSELTQAGFNVPQGFVVSSKAYQDFVQENDLEKKISQILKLIKKDDPRHYQDASHKIQKLFETGTISRELSKDVFKRYSKMGGLFKHAVVAIRSSLGTQEFKESSFAGQQESFLNISGESNCLEAIKKCWSSLFSAQAIFYRENKNLDHFAISMGIVIQEMVQAEVSGVAMTSDPTGVQKHVMTIEAIWGLGKLIVSGEVEPDRYLVERHSLEVLETQVSSQDIELLYKGGKTKESNVPKTRRLKQKLDESQIKELAKVLQKIHAHYYFPQDVEWVFYKKQFSIVHVRPLTTIFKEQKLDKSKIYDNKEISNIILEATGASPGIVQGIVRKVESFKEIKKVKKGDILVSKNLSPDFISVMKVAGGIIVEEGAVTSHAAIVARELGIPCVVGADNATKVLKEDQAVVINGSTGTISRSLIRSKQEIIKTKIQESKINPDLKTSTKIYLNASEPERAKELSELEVNGIGLLRAEFMIAQIGIHPKHLLAQGKQQVFVEKLKSGIEEFCEAFSPREVMYRTSDLKSNEYRNLAGGRDYEPEETNPMLGFRGAYRYIKDPQVFELELAAIAKVREVHKNLGVIIPYVRTPQELLEVKRIMAASGLIRGPNFKLWMMVELPINVLLINDFINIGIDGISIGTNDLTMLITGTDRDNNEVRDVYNELNPGVLMSLEKVIEEANRAGITSSVCGQAVSSYDTLIEQLVNWGITSVSVNSDSVGRVQRVVSEAERNLIKYGKNN